MRDVIVIGAGGCGAVVAKELAARGLDVLMLEAGARAARPRSEWSHFEADANDPLSGFFRWGPADRSKPAWLRDVAQNMQIQQVAGVGGTTKHFFGNSPRAPAGVFAEYDGADRSAYDTGHVFPFPYAELRAYYEWVEETLPVHVAPMGLKEKLFLEAAQRSGLPLLTGRDLTGPCYRPQPNAILPPGGTAGKTSDPALLRHPQAKGCTFCGHCIQGCMEPIGAPRNLAAKRSVDNSYIPMALTADAWAPGGRAVTLVSDAFATRINVGLSLGRPCARGVTWRVGATGAICSEDARVVVLAGGCVENPRLWRNSGLPNPNGWVGRGLTDHHLDVLVGITPSLTRNSHGPASAARIDHPGRGAIQNVGLPPSTLAGLCGLSDSGMAGLYNDSGRAREGADTIGRLVGRRMTDTLANLDRLLTVAVLTDDDVEADNHVTLSLTVPPDAHGLVPRVVLDSRARSRRTQDNRRFLVQQAVALLRTAGATRVHRLDIPPLLIHLQSTMRMGTDEATSVIDAGGEARAVGSLFVADTSALANGVGGVNPTLTAQALATRTAEQIFKRCFGGDGWVAHEAPVSSIDPRVTGAVVARGI